MHEIILRCLQICVSVCTKFSKDMYMSLRESFMKMREWIAGGADEEGFSLQKMRFLL